MSYIQLSRTTIAVLLSAFLLHSCQQPQLSMARDELKQQAPSTLQALLPKAGQSTEAIIQQEPSGVVLTSSSESSPDAKQADPAAPDRNGQDQLVANASQGNALTYARADTTITEANGKEVARKRPATAQLDKIEEQRAVAKQAKIEAPSPAHKAWFASFTQTVVQIEEDLEDEAAWDNMERLLNEGEKNNFLTTSITCPNDSTPATEYEYTPLHYAAARGLLALVKELVEQRNVPVDIQTQDNKSTPLHLAASRGHLDVVRLLVDRDANPDITDSEGGGVLHYAAAGRKGEMNRDVIEYLVAKGADFKKTMNPNTSMLDMAVLAGNIPVIEYWEDNYANSLDSDIDVLTKEALILAKHRLRQYPKERSIQVTIIRCLQNLLEVRRNKETHATK